MSTSVNQLLPREKIVDFCLRWHIEELALFGSILRDDFGPKSDVDMLVSFADDVRWGLFDHVQMQNEMETLLQRSVDLISSCCETKG
jgi:uncharacterized protein